jgi:signal transduction histidine kinase
LGSLFSLGIDNFTLKNDRLRIKLVNQISVLLFFLEFPYYFIFQKMGLLNASLFVIPAALSNLIVLFLNHRRKYVLAGLSFISFCSVTLLYYASVLGKEANAQLVYFALIPLGFIFFFKKRPALILLGTSIPLASLLLLETRNFQLFSKLNLEEFHIHLISVFANITTATLLILSIYFFYNSLKRVNEELENANTTLETQKTSLQTTYEDLQTQQKLLEKSWHDTVYAQLTRTIAHELKNPLFEFGMVIGALRTTLDDRETTLMFLDSLGQTIEELMELLHAMLESGGANVGEAKEMTISDVMRRVLLLADGSMKKRNIRLHKDFAELPDIMGDPKSYLMIFSNLIVNAMEAMSEDDGPGGDLTVRLIHNAALYKSKYGICVEIEDTGVGIPKSRHGTIFKGGQSSKNIDERQRGIGLALVWKLIHQMGGEITVHSDPDVKPGTMFRIVV